MLQRLEKASTAEDFNEEFAEILDGGMGALPFLSTSECYKIAVKVSHLKVALELARDVINACERFSFRECCDSAVAQLSHTVPKDERVRGITVTRWFRQFRKSRTLELPLEKRQALGTRKAIEAYMFDRPSMCYSLMYHMKPLLRAGMPMRDLCATAYRYFHQTLLPIGAREDGYMPDFFRLYLGKTQLLHLNHISFEAWFRDALVRDHQFHSQNYPSFA